MRRSSVGAALVVLVLFQVPSAFADPIAQWTGPWIVTLGFSASSDNVQLRRAFGEDAQADEEILNVGSAFEPLPGTQAWAKVYGEASGGTCFISCRQSFGTTELSFSRTFQLEGSPSGEWEVALIGRLVGDLSITILTGLGSGDLNPLAVVSVAAVITALSDPATPLLQFSAEHEVTQSFMPLSVDNSLVDNGLLRNGIYLVQGSITMSTGIDEARGASGTAVANFFNGDGAGLRVGVDVTPRVTEQSLIITSAYQTILHRSPTNEEIDRALAYLQAGGTRAGLRGRLLARFVAVF